MIRFFLLSLVFSFSLSADLLSPEQCLKDRLPSHDKRYKTFEKAMQLMEERNAQILVETGTARDGDRNCCGDGCSTLIFAKWIDSRPNGSLFSVDISEEAIKNSYRHTKMYRNVFLVCNDSVSFLKRFGREIDFLYLDSYDFDHRNALPSQQHHLKEIQAAYPFLTKRSIVMIDDCDLPHGGKGKLVIEFLLQKGWKILEKGYQVILVWE